MTRPRHASLALATRFPAALALAVGLLALAVPVTLAAPPATTVYTLTENNGNPEGVAWDSASQTFFTGTVGNGTIYRGSLGDPSVDVWIPGPPAALPSG